MAKRKRSTDATRRGAYGPNPRYLMLAEDLVAKIQSGELRPLDQLPTEHELMQQRGFSRVTVRRAMSVLAKRGMVVRKRGLGTFVAAPKVRQNLAVFESFYDTFIGQGIQPEIRLLDYRLVEPEGRIAEALDQTEAMLLIRRWCVAGIPFALTQTHIHPSAKSISHAEAESHFSFQILEQLLHYTIGRADLTIRAEGASDEVARHLEMKHGEPLLVLERLSYASSGEPLEHTCCYLRADAYELGLPLQGSFPIFKGLRKPAEHLRIVG